MRILNLVCGIAVLLTTLHFAHGIHHVLTHHMVQGAAMWAGIFGASVMWVLSFVGGCLLIRSAR